jgi:hypothetical protein
MSTRIVRSRPSGEAGKVESHQTLPARELKRIRKLRDVILKALAQKLTRIEAAEAAGRVLVMFPERYCDLNVRPFHEQLRTAEGIQFS